MVIEVIDSHTGGEPTRVVTAGGPDLGNGPLGERKNLFRLKYDAYRSAVVNEPRGSDAMVGALLCPPSDPSCCAGVIFFNNAGYLNMCGHGAIGVVATLRFLGRIEPGEHRIETPAGVVRATLHTDRRVTVRNVPSYRYRTGVTVTIESGEEVTGDIAWGGNWFFLSPRAPFDICLRHVTLLTNYTGQIRAALARAGITGAAGAEIDHIELFGPPRIPGSNAQSFVLCPGNAYDRSPCGTGTSAKLACLYADGRIQPGDVWRQESVIGSVFEGKIEVENGTVYPLITGQAYVNGCARLLFDERDPFLWGIRV